jgi:hypothetical protein
MKIINHLKRWRRKLKLDKRDIRYMYQRWTRGWDDSEMWSLDHSLAKLILPRLKRFQEVQGGYPASMENQEWKDIINEMVWAFQWYADGKQWGCEPTQAQDEKRADKGLQLFAKYYGHLWC